MKPTASELEALENLIDECQFICTWNGDKHLVGRLKPRLDAVREAFELFEEGKDHEDSV